VVEEDEDAVVVVLVVFEPLPADGVDAEEHAAVARARMQRETRRFRELLVTAPTYRRP
jgi:hypothetical protein